MEECIVRYSLSLLVEIRKANRPTTIETKSSSGRVFRVDLTTIQPWRKGSSHLHTRNILFSDARLLRIVSRPQSLKHVLGTAYSREAPKGDSRQHSTARLTCTLIGSSDLSGLPHLSNRCGLACYPDDWDHWAFVIGSMQENRTVFPDLWVG